MTQIEAAIPNATSSIATASWRDRNAEQLPWQQEAGPTAFEPFPDDTSYFGPPGQVWMINFRVRNLVAMVPNFRRAALK